MYVCIYFVMVSALGAAAAAGLYAFVAGWFNSRPKMNLRRITIYICVYVCLYSY